MRAMTSLFSSNRSLIRSRSSTMDGGAFVKLFFEIERERKKRKELSNSSVKKVKLLCSFRLTLDGSLEVARLMEATSS